MHSFSLSISHLLQYALLAAVAYILAGAPLSSIFTSNPSTSPQHASARSTTSLDHLDSLVIPEPNLLCEEHGHRGVFVLSREPLVVYIEGFLSDEEAQEVVKLR